MDCPVICSNTSSFPEVTNNSAAMFNPGDDDDIMHTIKSVVYDNDKVQDLIHRGRENIKNFNWRNCADKTMKVYKSVT